MILLPESNCSDPPPENWRLAGKAKLSATQNQVVTEVQYRNLAELSCSREGGSEQLRPKADIGQNFRKFSLRRLAEKNIPNCAGFSSGFKARGRRIVNYVTVIATQKLDDKDKQIGIFFDRNRLNSSLSFFQNCAWKKRFSFAEQQKFEY